MEGRLAERNREIIVRDETDKIINYLSEKIRLLVQNSSFFFFFFCLLFSSQYFYNLLY